VIAGLALAVALVSFAVTVYEQYLKPPKLVVELGSKIYLSYEEYEKGQSGVWANVAVSLLNVGASDAVVTRISGSLTTSDRSWSAQVIWQSFQSLVDETPPSGEAFKATWKMTGYASPMVVESRKATMTWISFEIYPLPANPPSAHYDLALAVAVSPKDAIGASWRGGLTLTPEDLRYLFKYCVAVKGVYDDSRTVELERGDGANGRVGHKVLAFLRDLRESRQAH